MLLFVVVGLVELSLFCWVFDLMALDFCADRPRTLNIQYRGRNYNVRVSPRMKCIFPSSPSTVTVQREED